MRRPAVIAGISAVLTVVLLPVMSPAAHADPEPVTTTPSTAQPNQVQPAAVAVTNVRVESQITGRGLPYVANGTVAGSVFMVGQTAGVVCQATGRELVAGSYTWYKIVKNGIPLYYPSYAFSGSPTHPACGTSYTMKVGASGFMLPTFSSGERIGFYDAGEGVKAICRTTTGQSVNEAGDVASTVWFFVRGYWLSGTRLTGNPTGTEFVPHCYGHATRMARAEIIERGRDWIADDVPYSMYAEHNNGYGSYRTDCSGFASMAWNLWTPGPNTTRLFQSDLTGVIAKSSLRAGDAFGATKDELGEAYGHIAIFLKWTDSSHTSAWVLEQAGSVGSTERVWTSAKMADYKAYRLDNVAP